MWQRRRPGHGVPFTTGRKQCAAATDEASVSHLAADGARSHLQCSCQRLISALRAVGVEALGIGDTDAAEKAGRIRVNVIDGSARAGVRCRRDLSAESRQDRVDGNAGQRPVRRIIARALDERGRRAIALSQTRATYPRRAPVRDRFS